MAAGARPEIALTRRPAAEGTADVVAGRADILFFLELAVRNDERLVGKGIHACFQGRHFAGALSS